MPSVRTAAVALAALAGLLAPAAHAPETGPLAGRRPAPVRPGPPPFWINPDSVAAQQVSAWRRQGRGGDARLLTRISGRPLAEWPGGPDPGPTVRRLTTSAARVGRMAVLVTYNIPDRDCGAYSHGGSGDAAEYRWWIDAFAAGIGDRPALVVVEPDAVAHLEAGCRAVRDADERFALLSYAVQRLRRQPRAEVYLDAGNASWIPDHRRLVAPLRKAGIARAHGFALNVSNYQTDATSLAYGRALSRALGGKHFVIDSSRNGRGPFAGPEAWCNPPGRGLGTAPTRRTRDRLLDAYLWVKRPGESDGSCRGGPPAGHWWPASALSLARNAKR
ncbi:glycoside hydrolase family 6 protein [Streptomyces sp. NPDC001941]|uniref:glycoside hydrolase family 6 protein n=1 Tax=Streptomyces sp. NPDC001941 TaxID=3154659 RepID=UPI003333B9C7